MRCDLGALGETCVSMCALQLSAAAPSRILLLQELKNIHILFWGFLITNIENKGPQNPILIIKAPIVPSSRTPELKPKPESNCLELMENSVGRFLNFRGRNFRKLGGTLFGGPGNQDPTI